jgi:predicted  nucleic acid-binding Zn-ribbon protein
MNRDEMVRKMHSRLDQWNHEIEHLMSKKDDVEASVRDEWHSRLDELRAHRDQARQQLQQIEQASESAWGDIKSGAELAWNSVVTAIDSALSRYRK